MIIRTVSPALSDRIRMAGDDVSHGVGGRTPRRLCVSPAYGGKTEVWSISTPLTADETARVTDLVTADDANPFA